MRIERWIRAVVAHRRAVLLTWAALAVAGALAATALPSLLANSLTVPGSPSHRAEVILGRGFHESTEGTFIVVFPERAPSRADIVELRRRLNAAARMIPRGGASRLTTDTGVVYGEVTTPYDLQAAKRWTPVLRAALATGPGPRALVTGEPALQHDLDPVLSADLRRGDAVAVIAAVVILLVTFGVTAAVAVPFVFAAATIGATLGLLYLLAHVFTVSSYAPNLADLIGLGLAIDYSLLVVHRFREELGSGHSVPNAVVATMRTAGRATLISGTAVALGLVVVFTTPVPLVRSLGVAGCLVPVVSIAAIVTLQPALLAVLGHRLAPRARRDRSARRWSRLAGAVTRRPRMVLLLASGLLLAAATPVGSLALTPGSISAIPQTSESARGLALLTAHAGPGVVTPIEIVIDAGASGAAVRPDVRAAVRRLANGIANSDSEAYVSAYGTRAPYVDPTGHYLRVFVIGRHDFGSTAMQSLVRDLRRTSVPAARFPPGVRVYVGGAPAQGVDYLHAVYGTALPFAAIVLGLAFLILLWAFRSLPLAATAVLLNVASVVATFGLLVLVFRDGVGADVAGLYRTPQLEGWVPIFLVAMLFGLSMDYEVFLVLRIREEHERGADTGSAVREGLLRTGPVITAAAAIMAAAFTGFVTGRAAGLQEFGAGLAIAVVLDATLVRLLIVPSLILLLGRHAWSLPGGGRRFSTQARWLARGDEGTLD